MIKLKTPDKYVILNPNRAPFISDVLSIDIACLNCGHIFEFEIRAYNSTSVRGCMECMTRHTGFVNDGCIMIDAYMRPRHNTDISENNRVLKRHRISIVEWVICS